MTGQERILIESVFVVQPRENRHSGRILRKSKIPQLSFDLEVRQFKIVFEFSERPDLLVIVSPTDCDSRRQSVIDIILFIGWLDEDIVVRRHPDPSKWNHAPFLAS